MIGAGLGTVRAGSAAVFVVVTVAVLVLGQQADADVDGRRTENIVVRLRSGDVGYSSVWNAGDGPQIVRILRHGLFLDIGPAAGPVLLFHVHVHVHVHARSRDNLVGRALDHAVSLAR